MGRFIFKLPDVGEGTAEALLRRAPGAQIRSYEARTMQPVFCDRPAFLCGSAPEVVHA